MKIPYYIPILYSMSLFLHTTSYEPYHMISHLERYDRDHYQMIPMWRPLSHNAVFSSSFRLNVYVEAETES